MEKNKIATIEEFAKDYIENTTEHLSIKNAFIAGAKWQQGRMYGEEEVLSIIKKFYTTFQINRQTIEEWFKKFKKPRLNNRG